MSKLTRTKRRQIEIEIRQHEEQSMEHARAAQALQRKLDAAKRKPAGRRALSDRSKA